MVKCNRGCGATDLRWKVVNSKYKLFNNNDLLHICNDGIQASELAQQKATTVILAELGLEEPSLIPIAEAVQEDKFNKQDGLKLHVSEANGDASKMFTINSTASGIAITGDDRHNAIYLPKIAISELVKALVDFI